MDGLAQLSFLVHGTLERLAAEHGVSIIQARLLGVLRDRTPTMKELGGFSDSTSPARRGLSTVPRPAGWSRASRRRPTGEPCSSI